jgi:hypothetical protein
LRSPRVRADIPTMNSFTDICESLLPSKACVLFSISSI